MRGQTVLQGKRDTLPRCRTLGERRDGPQTGALGSILQKPSVAGIYCGLQYDHAAANQTQVPADWQLAARQYPNQLERLKASAQ